MHHFDRQVIAEVICGFERSEEAHVGLVLQAIRACNPN
jgi:hypothetical protein